MIRPSIKKIAKKENWYRGKDLVFGFYKDYIFNIGNSSFFDQLQFKYIIVRLPSLNQASTSKIKKRLELKFTKLEFGEGFLSLEFMETSSYIKIEEIYKVLDLLVKIFQDEKIEPTNCCYKCKSKTVNLKYFILNRIGITYCNTCIKSVEKQLENINKRNDDIEKNYLKGFFGSILFSIPAVLLWVLIAVYLERLAAFMSIAFFTLGLKGYDYFKAVWGKLTYPTLVLSNIFMILFSNVVTAVTLLYLENIAITEIIYHIQYNQDIQKMIIDNIVLSFILSFFVWVSVFFALRFKKESIKIAKKA